MTESAPRIVNEWVRLNQLATTYKWTTLVLAVLCLFTSGASYYFAAVDPVVVIAAEGKNYFMPGKRRPVAIGEREITEFVSHFIETAYSWKAFSPDHIGASVAHLVTRDFREKFLVYLKKENRGKPDEKKIEQEVTGIRVNITEKAVTGYFDKIIRIDGVPVIAPSSVSLTLTQGPQTSTNPVGIYVTGILEHD